MRARLLREITKYWTIHSITSVVNETGGWVTLDLYQAIAAL